MKKKFERFVTLELPFGEPMPTDSSKQHTRSEESSGSRAEKIVPGNAEAVEVPGGDHAGVDYLGLDFDGNLSKGEKPKAIGGTGNLENAKEPTTTLVARNETQGTETEEGNLQQDVSGNDPANSGNKVEDNLPAEIREDGGGAGIKVGKEKRRSRKRHLKSNSTQRVRAMREASKRVGKVGLEFWINGGDAEAIRNWDGLKGRSLHSRAKEILQMVLGSSSPVVIGGKREEGV